MSAHHVDFAAQIRATAMTIGRMPTAEQVRDLNLALQTLAVLDHDGMTVTMGDGSTVHAYIAAQAAGFDLAQPTTPTPTSGATLGASIQAGEISFGQMVQRAHDADVAAQIAGWSNPWKAGPGFSRTKQAVVQNHDPALAARWKREAA